MAVLAAAVEANSEHPLGAAIVRFAQGFMELARQAQQAQQAGGQAATGDGSSGSNGGGGWLAAGGALPSCSDVQVSVGQGISAWVQRPAHDGSDNGGGDGCGSWDALLALQADAFATSAVPSRSAGAPAATTAGSAAAAPGGAVPEQGASAQDPAAESSTTQQLLGRRREGRVWVAVGSVRLMAGLALAPQAEAYMQDQEVGRCGVGAVTAGLALRSARVLRWAPLPCPLLANLQLLLPPRFTARWGYCTELLSAALLCTCGRPDAAA